MPIIKKYAETLTAPLTNYNTFLVDDNPNSTYFKITEFADVFTGGKNGFLIEGSPYLKETTEIKIQILDVNGDPIYFEPGNGIPEYYEGLSKLIAVYVYEDTPIGEAKITILGEAKNYIDADGITQEIPDEWKSVYNLKWEKTFKVNRLLSNEDKVRFYKRPVVNITEIVKPIFSNVVAQKIQTGSVNGTSQTPSAGQSLLNYTSPTSYLLTTVGNTFWTASVVDTYLEFPNLDYRPLVTEIINDRQIIVQPPYTDTSLGSAAPVENFTNEGFTASFNYTEGVDNLKTALTGSFAKINITDLTTFVGDVARVKIFRKSQSDLADYQFIQEIQLESNELLIDLESQIKNQEFYGIFDKENFKSQHPYGYWITSSNSLTATFNQDYLFNSVKLDGNLSSNYYYTSKSFNLTENTEYTLGLNYRGNSTTIGQLGQLRVFISGSKDSVIGGDEQDIVTFKANSSAILQKQIASVNFKAENFTNSKLYFEVKGTGWHIADVSLRAAQETAYSPDEITFIQSVPRSLPVETFDYRFEFYDINNNYVPVLVEESKTFDGGNLQTIRKQLRLIASSAGFQFDSGSNPVPPTIITIEEQKTLLTGSVHYTSASFDFFGNSLSSSQYTQSIYQQPIPLYSGSGQYPGVLQGIGTDNVFMRVQDFTGSRTDINVQLVQITGECEGFTDTINIYKILDGFGGVNHIIRPFRGTQIRNSSTSSLEIQAVRIDGINDILLSKQSYKNFSDIQLHIISRSKNYEINPNLEPDRFVNLSYVTASGMIYGLTTGSIGTGQIDYNAVFNRDSIDFRRTIFLMPSSSAASGPAYAVSSSVLASIILEDLQDGLDSGKVLFNVDTFTINPRVENTFRPTFAFATASFAKRATAGENENITSSFQVYPSMSINKDWVPEYWLYYHTQSLDPTLTVVARDENKNIIPSQTPTGNVRSPLNQTKNLTLTFVYTEPWTSASVSIDKTFTIVPEGKQGDESIVFEVNPIAVTLGANSRGVINDFRPSITDIKLKQGASYLAFSSSAYTLNNLSTHGTFYIASSSIIEKNVKAGNIQFTSSFGIPYTSSLIISASSNMTDLSGSIEYPLIIHPYFTSSIYTASVVVNYTKVLEGAPPIQILISPPNATLAADEVGFVTPVGYSPANTTIQVKEGDDFLRFTTQSTAPGSWRINSIETRGGSIWNIRTGSLSSSSLSTATINYNRFDYPFVSASAVYTIQVYPFALGAGHSYTSSIFTRTQTFTKNVAPANSRKVDFKASSYTVNYDRNGRVSALSNNPIVLSATAFNTTSSADKVYFSIFDVALDGSETFNAQFVGSGNPVFCDLFDQVNYSDIAPDTQKTFKVKITDGNPYTSPTVNPYRAEAQLTISGIKAGQDSYKLASTNDNCSITADLWTTSLSGTGMKITTFNGNQQLTNANPLPLPNNPDDLDFNNEPIGVLGFSSASIVYKDAWINQATVFPTPTTNPASIGNVTSWTSPAVNKSGTIVYRVDFEGDRFSTNTSIRPLARQTQFVTQSFTVQFEAPAPYDVKMTNENASVVYKVSGQYDLTGTSNSIRAYRGSTELVNTNPLPATDTDAYGTTGLSKEKCRVSILSKSGHITLAGGLTAGGFVSGTPASIGAITGWADPVNNPTAEIVYQIECEGRQTLIKTQSLSIQYEGNTGPGIVMRGIWANTVDYIGSVETTNKRRDAVIWPNPANYNNETHYWAAVSGSGPNTGKKHNPAIIVGPQQPDNGGSAAPWVDSDHWQYLGEEEFFVAAKIAIFEESFVKNTINVGVKDINTPFANIVLAGGRTDPYIAIGQTGTVGTAGTSGTSAAPTGVIGYDRPGVFLGIYENGAAGTTGRFSIKTTSTSGKGMFWDGDTLTIVGAIKQSTPGVNEGRLMGAWASGVAYLTNDIVTYSGNTWTANSNHTSTNDTNAGTGYPGSGPWTIAPIAAKLLRLEASSQVFIEAQNGTLSPDWIELTSNKQNISATTNWTTSPSVTLYNASSGGSVTTTGNTVFLRKADFGSNTLVEVTATADSITDSVTIARVQEGTDALTIILTNESHTLPAANDGTVSSYAGSGTNIYIYEGATQLDYDGVGTAAGKWTLSTSVSNITAGAVSDGGNYAVIANHSNMTANQASVTFTLSGKKLNGDSFSITRVQSLTKSIAGAAGANGTDGAPGAGVVYRGPFTIGTQYFRNPAAPTAATRRDVVKGNDGAYYLCKLTYTPTDNSTRPPDGGSYTTYWETFGATFSSVATDILLAQDATITRGLVIGTDGLTNGFIRSTGATSLTAGQGFYLQQDGQMRFGGPTTGNEPYIYWNNAVLTIKGKIITDNQQVSEIGNWKVDAGSFMDSTEQIVLDANNKQIFIKDSSNTPRVFIKQGVVTSPSSTTQVTINALTTATLPASSGVGSIDIDESTFDTTGFSVSVAGTYYLGTPSWSGGSIDLSAVQPPGTFTGYGFASVHLDIYDTPDYTGNLIWSYTLASTPVGINSPGDEDSTTFNTQGVTVTFPAVDTYYVHTRVFVYGYADTAFGIAGSIDPSSITLDLQQAQTEIGSDGFIVLADNNNYASIKRTTSSPIIDVKTNQAYPALRITNSNASGRAIEVLDGDIFLSGTAGGSGVNNNNIRIQGGWIGTDNTAGGVRMGTDGTNSVLMGGNWPSQNANVATARLRPGNTKFGINGRELIFEASSIRTKTNIEDYPESAYESIKNIRPVLFTPLQIINSMTEETAGEEDYSKLYPMPNAKEYIGKQGGFIAEWLDADPEMRRYVAYGVSGSVIKTDSLMYDKLIVPLTKTVQILINKVESLEAHISSSM